MASNPVAPAATIAPVPTPTPATAPVPTPAPATTPTSAPSAPGPEFKIPEAAHLSVCKGPAAQAPSTCYRHKLEDLVSITVCNSDSRKRKIYEVPRELLKWHSSYFAAALDPDSEFQKSSDGELVLEGTFEVFGAFVCWLYTGRLKDPPLSTKDVDDTSFNHYLPTMEVVDIWIFADMRGIPGLANAAIDMLHELVAAEWKTAPNENIQFIYANTIKGSHLRRFTVDSSILTKSYKGVLRLVECDDPTAEFLVEAIPLLMNRGEKCRSIGREAWAKLDRCQWHDHSGPGGKLRLESRGMPETEKRDDSEAVRR